jgi:hypothetical protein
MMTIPDITGDNAVHQIVLPVPARWIQFTVAGAGTVRWGDANVSATQGAQVPASYGQMLPFMGRFAFYQPKELFAYVSTGATLSTSARE